ncbi:MAG TPA: amidohydrolase family protein [Trebonia sp.]
MLPGLVDTRWHMWNTLLRGMSDGRPAGTGTDRGGYFATGTAIGRHFRPGDVYAGTRLAAAEAADAGITTVHDWAHNVRGRDGAEAGLRPRRVGPARPVLLRLRGRARQRPADGPGRPGRPGLPLALLRRGRPPPPRHGLAGDGRVQPADASRAGAVPGRDRRRARAWPARSELQIGYGQPVTGELLAAGLPVGLSVDTTMLSGNADLFAVMKVAQACANGQARHEFALTARDVLRLATIDGARSLGLGAQTGSLAPGKRADVIVESVDAPNLGVLTDPVRLLVTAASPRDVQLVVADGRILKRDGVLSAVDVAEVTRSARESLSGVLARAAA